MNSLADIQQAFVHRYMDDDDRVIGVRVRELDGETVLYVEVSDRTRVELPASFRGLRVVVREAHRALLAYA